MSTSRLQDIGVVAIGRNEGERLRRCLASIANEVGAIVYVDSASKDGSVQLARSWGADVVELDNSQPFTAARSRNAGVARLLEIAPHLRFVQVVDGDCEIDANWLERALAEIEGDPGLAVVCGRRRERQPEASLYNRLADMEWDTPVGDARACGGDALIRIEAFRQIAGYDASIIAGEEPEMCMRLSLAGWRIRRIDAPMTLHDAAMTRIGQWWRRMVRSGHAYAEGHAMHGRAHGFNAREVRSIVAWAFVLPVCIAASLWFTKGTSAVLALGYLVLWERVRRHRIRHGDAPRDARLYATFCVLGKFPQLVGAAKYWANRMIGRRTRLIEYKPQSAVEARHA